MANSSLEFRDSIGANSKNGAQTSGTALPVNAARTGFQIQNQDTAELFVHLGAGGTTSVYHFVLKAATGAADGTGGSFSMFDGNIYQGIVSVASAGTPSYSILEL